MDKSIQEKRLSYLLEVFKAERDEYKDISVSGDFEENRRILRSLMNVRFPIPMPKKILKIQDEYLSFRAKEKGIVRLSDIPLAKSPISIWQGDITRLCVDAIVNAANSQMLGCFVPMHGCIDNVIHTFSGVQLRAECNRKMNEMRALYGKDYEQPTGVPMLTDAYNLPSKKVVHVVGPVVRSGLTPEIEKDLSDCYLNTLDLCENNALKSVAFCCISTGVFCFPPRRAAEIAVKSVTEWIETHRGSMERVIFNVFKDEDKKYYEELIR